MTCQHSHSSFTSCCFHFQISCYDLQKKIWHLILISKKCIIQQSSNLYGFQSPLPLWDSRFSYFVQNPLLEGNWNQMAMYNNFFHPIPHSLPHLPTSVQNSQINEVQSIGGHLNNEFVQSWGSNETLFDQSQNLPFDNSDTINENRVPNNVDGMNRADEDTNGVNDFEIFPIIQEGNSQVPINIDEYSRISRIISEYNVLKNSKSTQTSVLCDRTGSSNRYEEGQMLSKKVMMGRTKDVGLNTEPEIMDQTNKENDEVTLVYPVAKNVTFNETAITKTLEDNSIDNDYSKRHVTNTSLLSNVCDFKAKVSEKNVDSKRGRDAESHLNSQFSHTDQEAEVVNPSEDVELFCGLEQVNFSTTKINIFGKGHNM
ncbi:hypothetical protein DICVIV_05669 [Dictyocaulus viviparus]|uniref:Uncharacterized protein n=1 Tax=Dictyocaulus viviparus TaxID=29172 RepID=A0A0D8XUN2_DICVI|nr:hypothetical protein DICVIV_05669 [Dictyocaulus viviparus]